MGLYCLFYYYSVLLFSPPSINHHLLSIYYSPWALLLDASLGFEVPYIDHRGCRHDSDTERLWLLYVEGTLHDLTQGESHLTCNPQID